MKTKEERSDGKEMMGVNKREGTGEGKNGGGKSKRGEQRMVRKCAKEDEGCTKEKRKAII